MERLIYHRVEVELIAILNISAVQQCGDLIADLLYIHSAFGIVHVIVLFLGPAFEYFTSLKCDTGIIDVRVHLSGTDLVISHTHLGNECCTVFIIEIHEQSGIRICSFNDYVDREIIGIELDLVVSGNSILDLLCCAVVLDMYQRRIRSL